MGFFTHFLMYLGARSVIKEIERNQAEQQRILAEMQRLERARIAEEMRLQQELDELNRLELILEQEENDIDDVDDCDKMEEERIEREKVAEKETLVQLQDIHQEEIDKLNDLLLDIQERIDNLELQGNDPFDEIYDLEEEALEIQDKIDEHQSIIDTLNEKIYGYNLV